jgi:hypothetical protein
MKRIVLALSVLLVFSFTGKAQTAPAEHSIKVIGTAEMEIVPDEIYVSVTLKEYMKDKKKYSIEELEKGLVNFLEKITLTEKKDVKMDNMSAYVLAMKRKKKDEVISKSYEVKFKNPQQLYELYSVMDSLGISRAYVSRYSHSKMDEYKKQIKINAIKAARDKAEYLMTAIGQTAGKAINVTEVSGFVTVNDGTYDNFRENNYYSNTYGHTSYQSQVRMEDGDSSSELENSVGGKTIKLNYTINAEFAIQ